MSLNLLSSSLLILPHQVRVYLTNVESLCRRFLDESRERLQPLRDEAEAYREWWESLTEERREDLALDRTDNVLKAMVKKFFNEKEQSQVTSTLVMDALYCGARALEEASVRILSGDVGPSRGGRGSSGSDEDEGSDPGSLDGPEDALGWSTDNPPLVLLVPRGSAEVFMLAGEDALDLLEKASLECCQLPPYREAAEGEGSDYKTELGDRDERRLAELGRQMVEVFIAGHVFESKIQVAYREAAALRLQEALLREEEESALLDAEARAAKAQAEQAKKQKKKVSEKQQNRKGKRLKNL